MRRATRAGTDMRTRIDRLSVVNETTGCWNWDGQIDGHGYGRIKVKRGYSMAHRESYRAHVGEIPEGAVIDHLCRNTACVNPGHLEPVSQSENVKRGLGGFSLTGRCLSGKHDLSLVRTRSDGRRQCHECELERGTERNALISAAVKASGLSHRDYIVQHGSRIGEAKRVLRAAGVAVDGGDES